MSCVEEFRQFLNHDDVPCTRVPTMRSDILFEKRTDFFIVAEDLLSFAHLTALSDRRCSHLRVHFLSCMFQALFTRVQMPRIVTSHANLPQTKCLARRTDGR
jgi:hypothetical protein